MTSLFEGLADSSKKSYLRRLELVRALVDYKEDDYKFLKEYESVATAVLDKYDNANTIKTYFSTAYVASRDLKYPKDAQDFYHEEMLKYRDIASDLAKCNTLKDSKKQDWATWKQVRSVLALIPENSQDYLIVALYTLRPPLRRDFANLRVLKRKPRNMDSNVLVANASGVKLYLNQFKNVRRLGPQVIPFRGRLKRIIREHLARNKSGYLLSVDGKAMTRDQLGQ
jgi:hypothetical protein